MMLPDTGNPPADARELGRALMRGDRDELKLGYTWHNAVKVCVERYALNAKERLELAVYLRGFGQGLKFQRAELDASRIYQTFTDGAIAGAKESATGRTYPG